MITAVTLGHVVVGLALGTRFRVAALVPALVVSFITVLVSSIAAGLGPHWSVVAVVAALSALQIGFLAGAALRDRMIDPLSSPITVWFRAGR
jgi:uncharacterized membrane protein YfbV (UPF0208 family)